MKRFINKAKLCLRRKHAVFDFTLLPQPETGGHGSLLASMDAVGTFWASDDRVLHRQGPAIRITDLRIKDEGTYAVTCVTDRSVRNSSIRVHVTGECVLLFVCLLACLSVFNRLSPFFFFFFSSLFPNLFLSPSLSLCLCLCYCLAFSRASYSL